MGGVSSNAGTRGGRLEGGGGQIGRHNWQGVGGETALAIGHARLLASVGGGLGAVGDKRAGSSEGERGLQESAGNAQAGQGMWEGWSGVRYGVAAEVRQKTVPGWPRENHGVGAMSALRGERFRMLPMDGIREVSGEGGGTDLPPVHAPRQFARPSTMMMMSPPENTRSVMGVSGGQGTSSFARMPPSQWQPSGLALLKEHWKVPMPMNGAAAYEYRMQAAQAEAAVSNAGGLMREVPALSALRAQQQAPSLSQGFGSYHAQTSQVAAQKVSGIDNSQPLSSMHDALQLPQFVPPQEIVIPFSRPCPPTGEHPQFSGFATHHDVVPPPGMSVDALALYPGEQNQPSSFFEPWATGHNLKSLNASHLTRTAHLPSHVPPMGPEARVSAIGVRAEPVRAAYSAKSLKAKQIQPKPKALKASKQPRRKQRKSGEIAKLSTRRGANFVNGALVPFAKPARKQKKSKGTRDRIVRSSRVADSGATQAVSGERAVNAVSSIVLKTAQPTPTGIDSQEGLVLGSQGRQDLNSEMRPLDNSLHQNPPLHSAEVIANTLRALSHAGMTSSPPNDRRSTPHPDRNETVSNYPPPASKFMLSPSVVGFQDFRASGGAGDMMCHEQIELQADRTLIDSHAPPQKIPPSTLPPQTYPWHEVLPKVHPRRSDPALKDILSGDAVSTPPASMEPFHRSSSGAGNDAMAASVPHGGKKHVTTCERNPIHVAALKPGLVVPRGNDLAARQSQSTEVGAAAAEIESAVLATSIISDVAHGIPHDVPKTSAQCAVVKPKECKASKKPRAVNIAKSPKGVRVNCDAQESQCIYESQRCRVKIKINPGTTLAEPKKRNPTTNKRKLVMCSGAKDLNSRPDADAGCRPDKAKSRRICDLLEQANDVCVPIMVRLPLRAPETVSDSMRKTVGDESPKVRLSDPCRAGRDLVESENRHPNRQVNGLHSQEKNTEHTSGARTAVPEDGRRVDMLNGAPASDAILRVQPDKHIDGSTTASPILESDSSSSAVCAEEGSKMGKDEELRENAAQHQSRTASEPMNRKSGHTGAIVLQRTRLIRMQSAQVAAQEAIRSTDPETVLLNANYVACGLCRAQTRSTECLRHPFFGVRSFFVCNLCSSFVSCAVAAAECEFPSLLHTESCDNKNQTSIFNALVEEMILVLVPSALKRHKLEDVHKGLLQRCKNDVVGLAESLSVPYEMLSIMRVLFQTIGLSFDNGKLTWPSRTVALPSTADAQSLVREAITRSILDIKKGRCPGETVWNAVFRSTDMQLSSLPSCFIFGKLLSLVNVSFQHVGDCQKVGTNCSGNCNIRIKPTSVARAMWRARGSALLPSVKAVFGATLTEKDESGERSQGNGEKSKALEIPPNSCCICATPRDSYDFPFQYFKCCECSRRFCSVCVTNVLGSSELSRAVRSEQYTCILCRSRPHIRMINGLNPGKEHVNAEHSLNVKTSAEQKSKRKCGQGPSPDRPSTPFLLLSSELQERFVRRANGERDEQDLGFAKLCEVVNKYLLCKISVKKSDLVCLECKILHPAESCNPVSGQAQESGSELLRCAEKGCHMAMHKRCCTNQPRASSRGIGRSRAMGIQCPQHKCLCCSTRDEGKLVKCRTCPSTYCRDHLPPLKDIHVHSLSLISCSKCKSNLRTPQTSIGLTNLAERERSKKTKDVPESNIAVAFAIHQHRRLAGVDRKLTSAASRVFLGEAAKAKELKLRLHETDEI